MGSNPTLSAITLPMITSCFVMKQEVFAYYCRFDHIGLVAEAGRRVLRGGEMQLIYNNEAPSAMLSVT